MWDAWVRSLGQEDSLEEEMATHSSILAKKNTMARGAWWATVHGVVNSQTRQSTHAGACQFVCVCMCACLCAICVHMYKHIVCMCMCSCAGVYIKYVCACTYVCIKYVYAYICVCLYIGEGNDTPLQYSCLENPMDRGAWWATVHGVVKSQT